MSERTLFDYVVEVEPDPPCQRHSVTSREAADAIKPDASELRRRVLAYLRGRGEDGATDEEMQTGIPMPANTERPRRCELVEMGSVVDSGRKRRTRSGRNAVVWVAGGKGGDATNNRRAVTEQRDREERGFDWETWIKGD
jgi:hypothetical protein